MSIGILLIALSIVNISLLILAIFLIFTPFYYYLAVVIFISIVLSLLISTMFFKNANHQLEVEKDILKSFKIIRCAKRENGVNVIEFIMKDNKWVSKQDEKIEFALDNYLFKKSFIIARVIREVRYPKISKQLYLSKLFKLKLENNKIDNLIVRFIDGKVIKEYFVVKNYISKNTFLSSAVSRSKYHSVFLSNRSYQKYLKQKIKIDENIYLG